MTSLIINSQKRLEDAQIKLSELFETKKYLRVSIAFGADRSLLQNKLQFKWFKDMENQGDMHSSEYRNYCKLTFGIPIMCQDTIKHEEWHFLDENLNYEQKLILMSSYEVTRNFTRNQMREYLDEIWQFGFDRGFRLTNPDKYGLSRDYEVVR